MTMTDLEKPVLECKDLCISYYTRTGEIEAVIDFNLKVLSGEAVGLVGESGCGKSTVALAIMQYMGRNGAIVSGEINFMGQNLCNMNEAELRKIRGKDISMVYQEPMASLNPSMKIGKQLVEVPIRHEGISYREGYQRAATLLSEVNLPDPESMMARFPHQLSGGQQQRVLIAMALLSRPKLLLLDEPTTALDVTVEAGIVDLIRGISKKYGTSLLYISHNLGLILETCNRITVMYSGQAVEHGSIKQVFDEMRHPYTRGLFASIPLPGADRYEHPLVPIRGQLPLPQERPKGCYFSPRCDFFRKGTCDKERIPMEDVGEKGHDDHVVRCARHSEIDWKKYKPEGIKQIPCERGEEILVVEDMKKYYEIKDRSLSALIRGGSTKFVKANDGISFAAHEAETLAIVGETGCGKSTLAKVLMGLECASSGNIKIRGNDIASLPVQKRDPQMIGMLQIVFQNPFETLNPSYSVGSQIARVLYKFGVTKGRLETQNKTKEMFDMVKLPRAFAMRKPRQLSGGQKQRIGIARAFAGDTSVIIADEPVSALDVSVQASVTSLLSELQRKKRTTLLFISHDLSLVRYLADRVLVMYLGKIVEFGTTEEIFSPPYHPYTEALLSAVPIADTSIKKKRIILKGELPSPSAPPPGCPFQTRCPRKIGAICEQEAPPIREISSQHNIACHLSLEELRSMEPVIEFAKKEKKVA